MRAKSPRSTRCDASSNPSSVCHRWRGAAAGRRAGWGRTDGARLVVGCSGGVSTEPTVPTRCSPWVGAPVVGAV
ncbi:MAG: hypothetical protein M1429_02220 [Patescibacteria group bacterium]|nr:hypothetical protein [Patescibacteria group bacterium]